MTQLERAEALCIKQKKIIQKLKQKLSTAEATIKDLLTPPHLL